MKYKNKEIGTPTIETVIEYIQERKYTISPQKVFSHYRKNDWCGSDGQPLKCLEAAINGCNGKLDTYGLEGDEMPESYKKLSTFKITMGLQTRRNGSAL